MGKLSDARTEVAIGMKRVATTAMPVGQKFPPGTRVHIAKDLGSSMPHFPSDRDATVLYTHAHAFQSNLANSYCLDIDGVGEVSWYYEHQLEELFAL